MSVFPRIPAKLNSQFDCQALYNFEGNYDDTAGIVPAANMSNSQGTDDFVFVQDHTGRQAVMSTGSDKVRFSSTGITRLQILGDVTVQAVAWFSTFGIASSGQNLFHFSGGGGAFPTENYLWNISISGADVTMMIPQFYWESAVSVFEITRDLDFTCDNGRWYHIVGVRDTSAGEGHLYVNGALIKTQNLLDPPTSGSNGRVNIGKNPDGNIGLLNGTMLSSLKVSNRILTASEITQEFNRTRGSV